MFCWKFVWFCWFFLSFCVWWFLVGVSMEMFDVVFWEILLVFLSVDWIIIWFFCFGCCKFIVVCDFLLVVLMIWWDIRGFFVWVVFLFFGLFKVWLNGLLLKFFFFWCWWDVFGVGVFNVFVDIKKWKFWCF